MTIGQQKPKGRSALNEMFGWKFQLEDEIEELERILTYKKQELNDVKISMEKEEMVLFPRIKQLEKHGLNQLSFDAQMYEYIKLPIINMEIEHDDAGNKMNEIRLLTNNYTPPKDACTTYKLMYACLHAFEIDLHQHVHLENSILFPKALALEKEIQIRTRN